MTNDTSATQPQAAQARRLETTAKTDVKKLYAMGDTCFIDVGAVDESGKPVLTEGQVIYWFEHRLYPGRHYVIKVNDPLWSIFETRDWLKMSPTRVDAQPFRDRWPAVHPSRAEWASKQAVQKQGKQ